MHGQVLVIIKCVHVGYTCEICLSTELLTFFAHGLPKKPIFHPKSVRIREKVENPWFLFDICAVHMLWWNLVHFMFSHDDFGFLDDIWKWNLTIIASRIEESVFSLGAFPKNDYF